LSKNEMSYWYLDRKSAEGVLWLWKVYQYARCRSGGY